MAPGGEVRDNRQKEPSYRAALECLERNEVGQADAILTGLLTEEPSDTEALQLLGLVRRAQGRAEDAEDCYRKSLAINPLQPHVYNNLGNLLQSQNRLEEGIAALREAVRLKPNYAEAHLNLGLALSASGDHAGAEKSYRRTLHIQPNSAPARQALASELNALDRPKEAERILRQALAAGSSNPRQIAAFEHNLGVSLKMQKRFDEALAHFDSARTKAPDLPVIEFGRGETLQHLGRNREAVESYNRALRLNPLDLNVHLELNKLLYRMGDDDAFLRSYDDVASLYPEIGELPLEKARFLFLREEHEAALDYFERAARLLPDDPAPHEGLSLVLSRLDDFKRAVREHEIVVKLAPQSTQAWRNYAETFLRAGDPKAARTAAERAMAIDPRNQASIAIWTLALRLLNDPLEEEINQYGDFVRVFEIPPPEGYSDIESFNRDLNAYLDRLHRDRRESIEQTLRTGTQTFDNLFDAGHGPVELLRKRIDATVAEYIAGLKTDSDHLLLQRKAPQFAYSASWSARLHDCGFHTNHVHSKGWISSAYYVAVPDAVTESNSDAGWIKFGEPNFECGIANAVRRKIQPKPGRLVLFPSYMWHGTLPFRSTQSRTTIAFDAVPKRS